MSISKIFQIFLLPGVLIFVLLILGLILSLKKRKKIGNILIILGIIFYYFFSITPVADFLLKPLENKYSQLKREDFQKANIAVLLLGGSKTDVLRGVEALRIYNNRKIQIIISGTDPLKSEMHETEKVKEFLVERGILLEDIILEDKSKNTRENANNTKEIVGGEPFFLITSASHMPRAMETFKKAGLNPIPAPTDFKIEKDYSYNILDFFPGGFEKSSIAFYEYYGLTFYKILDKIQ